MPVTRRSLSRGEFLRMGGVGLAGAVLLGTTGCGGGQEGGASSITWQAIPSYSTLENTDQARVEYLEGAISSWEEGSEFTIEPKVTSADVTAAMARLLEQASQNRAPDIAQVDSYIFPRFYDFARDIEEQLGDIPLDDFFPFARQVMTGGGGVKGIQFTTDVRVLYYRKDLISDPPASWEDLLQTGEDVKDQAETPFLFPAGRDEATITTSLLPHFWAAGGELTDEEGNPAFGEGENRQAMLDALGFIRDCVESGITPRRVTEFAQETDINGDAASGQTAMFLGGNWQVSLLKEIVGADQFVEQWGVAPIPSPDGQDHATTAGGWAWGVFTDDEEKQQAAVDFLKAAFVGDEGMAQWCNVGGYLPPRQSVFDIQAYEGNEYTDTFRQHLEDFARNRPPSESYQDISTALQVAVTQVVSGESSPEQALQTAVDSVPAG
jgi:multiple sugar transport system substrate-binding protein